MPSRVSLVLLPAFLSVVFLCACKPPEGSHAKAIIGAVLIDGSGGPPRSDSVVLVSDERIRAAGARSTVPILSEADKIDGSGKFLVPALVDICDSPTPPGLLHPADAGQARTQVAEAAARKVGVIHVGQAGSEIVEAALDAARSANIPVIGHITTQAGARLLVDNGATGLVGMIIDTEDLDAGFLTKLRDLRIIVAPALSQAGASLDIAKRNTRRLFQAGVPLAVASQGSDPINEAELLVEAGVPPLDVIVAATRNGAMALGQLDRRGTIEEGKQADLVLVLANPGEDIRNLRRVALRMTAGIWQH